MKVLFVHQNFPGQYKHLAPRLAALGHEVKALCMTAGREAPGVEIIRYTVQRGSSPDIHRWASDFETKVIRGEACARAMIDLKQQGFTPDIILSHPGWGETMFAREVFPRARMLSFIEYYYRAHGQDVNFDPEFENRTFDDDARTVSKTANSLMTLEAMDWGVSPTLWQRNTVPELYRPRISVIHDGVDTDHLRPMPGATLTLPDGQTLRAGDEVLTFVNRNLEPLRGFHIFMRALPAVLKSRPQAKVVIVGGDSKGYGGGGGWRERMLDELGDRIDPSRISFVGKVPYPNFVRLLQVSRAHVYLSYPFVLSWSMIEALSTGCLVIGGATDPVKEVITDGETGVLVDFFDVDGLSAKIIDALERPGEYLDIRRAARALAVRRYDLETVCLPEHLKLIDDVLQHGRPAD
jgi:glycosyltransferase involved in cell wall biosynthesis